MPTVDGIVSGIDTTALINAVLGVQKVSIDSLKAQVKDYERQKEGVAGVKSRMTTLAETIRKIDSVEKFQSYKVTGESEQFTLTASTGAAAGSHSIRVVSLASAQSSSSQGFDSKTAKTLGQGTFSVTVGSTQHDITLDASNNSLEGLAGELNELEGVSAYVLDTGAATERSKLVVQGEETGAAHAITFDTTQLSNGLLPAFTSQSDALDAEVIIDGVTVHSGSNTLDGLVPGLEIELHATSATADSVTVQEDLEGMRGKLKEVVDAYNALVDFHATQTVFNPEEGLRGGLVGESTTRRGLEDLGSMFSGQYDGPGTIIDSLSLLGVSTGRDGKLTLDEDAFDEAMTEHGAAIKTFLTAESGPLGKIAQRIDDLYVDSDEGALVSRQEGIDSTIETLNERITRSEERMEAYGKLLRAQFTSMESALGQIRSTQSYLSSMFASATTSG